LKSNIILISAFYGIIGIIINLVSSSVFYPIFGIKEDPSRSELTAKLIIGAVLIAPIIETALMIAIIKSIGRFSNYVSYFFFITIFIYGHRPFDSTTVGKFFLFSFFFYQYFLLMKSERLSSVFLCIAIQHSAQNAIVLSGAYLMQ